MRKRVVESSQGRQWESNKEDALDSEIEMIVLDLWYLPRVFSLPLELQASTGFWRNAKPKPIVKVLWGGVGLGERGFQTYMNHSLSIFSVKAQTARANTKILPILSLVGLELLFQATYSVVMFSQTVMWLQNYIWLRWWCSLSKR